MNNERQIFALFGNPVGHSLSPHMHRAAYEQMGLDADYVAFCVTDLQAAVAGIRGLDIRGVSVTLPFKTDVIPFLDDIDETARRIGAVNTILNDGGRLTGLNTDAAGLMRDLKEVMPLEGKHVAVLGAGGAARAAAFGAHGEGAEIIIVNRDEGKGLNLAFECDGSFQPLSEIASVEADVLINTTSVGMAPDIGQSPVPAEILGRFPWVVDIIYNPLETKFLRDAATQGCRIRNGIGMFVHQGAEQIRIWAGQDPPVEVMRQAVMEGLQR